MKRMATITLAAAALTAATTVPAAAAVDHSGPKNYTFGSCRAEGDYAICDASGTANDPVTRRAWSSRG